MSNNTNEKKLVNKEKKPKSLAKFLAILLALSALLNMALYGLAMQSLKSQIDSFSAYRESYSAHVELAKQCGAELPVDTLEHDGIKNVETPAN